MRIEGRYGLRKPYRTSRRGGTGTSPMSYNPPSSLLQDRDATMGDAAGHGGSASPWRGQGQVRPNSLRGPGRWHRQGPETAADQELSSGSPGGLTSDLATASLERFQAASHLAY
ncbi:hypothetical protein JCM4814A_89980 [Streptomyces phaeofaciens JCM 4814]|uniref:Uncharacterized protein n=1 Tax=Streptomyces phaeofaciens TaxID=68254 RepID=A0A918HND6_9ACTN|nr:hypothetical protein GCM10010226_68440 [Streptomyces phaeofaciens]